MKTIKQLLFLVYRRWPLFKSLIKWQCGNIYFWLTWRFTPSSFFLGIRGTGWDGYTMACEMVLIPYIYLNIWHDDDDDNKDDKELEE